MAKKILLLLTLYASLVTPVFANGSGKTASNPVNYLALLGNSFMVIGVISLVVLIVMIVKQKIK